MNLQLQLEDSQNSVRKPDRLRRSGSIALVSMVDRPFFRSARPQESGAAWIDCQMLFDVVQVRKRADGASAGGPPAGSGAQGLGLYGDTMLDRDLAG